MPSSPVNSQPTPPQHQVRFAWLSIGAALTTIALKISAYFVTNSVGLLSDALESLVNLVAASVALVALTVASRPADHRYEHGYEKAEYFSSGLEGGLIVIAAIGILISAVERLFHPGEVYALETGVALSIAATMINWVVARVLLRAAKSYDSITLEADAHHLMTDVWTSLAVIVGVFCVRLTGIHMLDPLIALAVGARIIAAGFVLVRRSAQGLMDVSLPENERKELIRLLDSYRSDHMQWHALRTRKAGSRRFATVHVLVPGQWTVKQGHDLLEKLEADVRLTLPKMVIVTHLEPAEDPASFEDVELDRSTPP